MQDRGLILRWARDLQRDDTVTEPIIRIGWKIMSFTHELKSVFLHLTFQSLPVT